MHGLGVLRRGRPEQPGSVRPAEQPGQTQPALRTRILIVNSGQCGMSRVAQTLENAGFEVSIVLGWPHAMASVQQNPPSLILVCSQPSAAPTRMLRSATRAPILALLVEAGESAVIEVLAAGADDCQPASIEPREVVMRVRVLLRRSEWRQRPATGLPRSAT
jgi:two-component system, OmpR family, response regulator